MAQSCLDQSCANIGKMRLRSNGFYIGLRSQTCALRHELIFEVFERKSDFAQKKERRAHNSLLRVFHLWGTGFASGGPMVRKARQNRKRARYRSYRVSPKDSVMLLYQD